MGRKKIDSFWHAQVILHFEAYIHRCKTYENCLYSRQKWQFSYWNYTLKREFIDVKTMNIHQKTMVFIEKTILNVWKHTKI